MGVGSALPLGSANADRTLKLTLSTLQFHILRMIMFEIVFRTLFNMNGMIIWILLQEDERLLKTSSYVLNLAFVPLVDNSCNAEALEPDNEKISQQHKCVVHFKCEEIFNVMLSVYSKAFTLNTLLGTCTCINTD